MQDVGLVDAEVASQRLTRRQAPAEMASAQQVALGEVVRRLAVLRHVRGQSGKTDRLILLRFRRKRGDDLAREACVQRHRELRDGLGIFRIGAVEF